MDGANNPPKKIHADRFQQPSRFVSSLWASPRGAKPAGLPFLLLPSQQRSAVVHRYSLAEQWAYAAGRM
jgi:hypothetical protein